MLPDKTIDAIGKAVETTVIELWDALQAVYDRDGEAAITLTLSIAKFGDLQTDIQASGVIVTNTNERPVWKAERQQAKKRIRINDRQLKLPGQDE
jgi:hypothetical protein